MGTNSTEKGNFTMTKVENGEEGDAPFALPTWFVVAMLCTNLAGAALNGISARRIVDAFDTGRIIFTLLLADAVLGCAGCAVGAANAVALSRPSSNDHLACTSFFVATLVPILFGLVISSHISVMRLEIFLKHSLESLSIYSLPLQVPQPEVRPPQRGPAGVPLLPGHPHHHGPILPRHRPLRHRSPHRRQAFQGHWTMVG